MAGAVPASGSVRGVWCVWLLGVWGATPRTSGGRRSSQLSFLPLQPPARVLTSACVGRIVGRLALLLLGQGLAGGATGGTRLPAGCCQLCASAVDMAAQAVSSWRLVATVARCALLALGVGRPGVSSLYKQA